jgi:murein DD-endopeptidase MepM/ murein hydrolase activator NlpD
VPGAWPWPVGGVVTSEFGLRDGRPHTGIDIAVPTGTPIHPTAPGTVSFVGQLGGYGNLVIIEHAGGVRTYYAHLSRFGGFAVGDAVSQLDSIGAVGCTGNCTGPHLHFETRTADTPQNPRSFLTAR